MSQPPNPWLVRPRPNPAAALRLFCLPHAGGAASLYRQWPDRLPAGVEVCAVQLPGRESRFREPLFARWQPLVAALAESLRAAIDRPYAVFGHSMGALVAFELVRHLRRLGMPQPAHLLVSGHPAPHRRPDEPVIHALPDPQFVAELRQRNGTPDIVLDDAELMQLFLPLLRADFAVCETYVFQSDQPLDCPITAFGGLDDTPVTPERIDAWRELTTAAFERHMFPGDHFFHTTSRVGLLDRISQVLRRHLGEEPSSWSQPPADLRLAPDEVHVWRLALDRPADQVERLGRLLDASERERAERFRFPKDRNRYVVGRGLLRTVLGRYLRQAPEALRFTYAAQGKPLLADSPFQFNLAHSDNLALLAVAGRRAVGVDVERQRATMDILPIAERHFAPAELANLRVVLPNQRLAAFFTIWTRKEAYIKATGLGLQVALERFAILQTPGTHGLRLSLLDDPADAARWSLRDLAPGPEFVGALAVAGHGWRLHCWAEPNAW
jgi:medium-chain acyl-[acyl-carrier-protein] hydrolase